MKTLTRDGKIAIAIVAAVAVLMGIGVLGRQACAEKARVLEEVQAEIDAGSGSGAYQARLREMRARFAAEMARMGCVQPR